MLLLSSPVVGCLGRQTNSLDIISILYFQLEAMDYDFTCILALGMAKICLGLVYSRNWPGSEL
jgi:hypothetical protein